MPKPFLMRPRNFFWILTILMALAAIFAGDRTGFVNLYETHFAVSQRGMALLAVLIFLSMGWMYGLAAKKSWPISKKRIRNHVLFSLAGPLSTLPVLFFSRTVAYPITDLIEYSADMQFNDRLLLTCFGFWLATLLSQLFFAVLLFKSAQKAR